MLVCFSLNGSSLVKQLGKGKPKEGERESKCNDIILTTICGTTSSTCMENCQALLNQLPANRLINPCLAQRSKQITVMLEFSTYVESLKSKFRRF